MRATPAPKESGWRWTAPSLLRWAAVGFLVSLVSLGTLGLACAPAPPQGFDLMSAVEISKEKPSTGDSLDLTGEPSLESWEVDHETRPVVVLPQGTWSWSGVVPPRARLELGAASATEGTAIAVSVALWQGEEGGVLAVGSSEAGEEAAWVDLSIDLAAYAGRRVRLEMNGRVGAEGTAGRVAWGPAVLTRPPAAAPRERPNVVLIVIDTLRHDHLSAYGYPRQTTPRIDQLLAAPGVVLEDAYAQAPWTLPSMVSLFTGRYPTELLADEAAAFRIPDAVPVLAEIFQDLGYETAAFYANPALHAGTGFGRGFRTFFAPPADFAWFQRHADGLNRRLLPWVRAHRHRPFLLYAHYLDPHDPYDNPEIADNLSPFEQSYDGTVTGEQVHRIYGGLDPLPDPARDVAHLKALYDSEIHYVDRHVGELLEALGPEVLKNTLVVLTSDHGEELYDHGGWKHGQSLYEEQIHVPLIFRWDGRLPAGKRLAGTVELLDILPTLVAAAGGEVDARWQGRNLLPALEGREPLARRVAFSQHLSGGPLRASVILDGRKLMLFNRREPFEPPDDFQGYLWRKDLQRFADGELYDLAGDSGETVNRFGQEPALAANLAQFIHKRLDRRLPGLRIQPRGLAAGSRLEAKLRFDGAAPKLMPYFLAAEDQWRVEGEVLHVEFRGQVGAIAGRALLAAGDFTSLQVESLRLDGRVLTAASVQAAAGVAAAGPLDRRELRAEVRPEARSGAGLLLWEPDVDYEARAAAEDEETRRRLKALGYLIQ